VEHMEDSQRQLTDFRAKLKPLDSTDQQLREFRETYDAIPWNDVEEALHANHLGRPGAPNYADYVDRTASEQEDLLIAFQELFTAPTLRHGFSVALAAFIDIVVFLLAYASRPYFFGSAEQRWLAAGSALNSRDEQVFVRDFLRKLRAQPPGMVRVKADDLTPGELQVCSLLVSKGMAATAAGGMAATAEQDGRVVYLLGPEIHEQLLDVLATPGVHLRASAGAVDASR
jgi:hypothetical protein